MGPPIHWLNLECLSYFEHNNQYFLNMCLLVSDLEATLNHIPLKYRCLIKKRNWIKHISLIRWQEVDPGLGEDSKHLSSTSKQSLTLSKQIVALVCFDVFSAINITNNDKFDCPFPPSLHLLTVIDDINRSILPTYQAVRIYNLHISLLTSPGVMTGPCKKSLVMFSKISNHGFLEVPLHFIHKDSWGPGTWQASVLLWVEKWAGEHQVSRLLTTSNSQVTENDHHKHFITSVYCHTLI